MKKSERTPLTVNSIAPFLFEIYFRVIYGYLFRIPRLKSYVFLLVLALLYLFFGEKFLREILLFFILLLNSNFTDHLTRFSGSYFLYSQYLFIHVIFVLMASVSDKARQFDMLIWPIWISGLKICSLGWQKDRLSGINLLKKLVLLLF
jgi:hypothetical protein